jgi:hypothetical protein
MRSLSNAATGSGWCQSATVPHTFLSVNVLSGKCCAADLHGAGDHRPGAAVDWAVGDHGTGADRWSRGPQCDRRALALRPHLLRGQPAGGPRCAASHWYLQWVNKHCKLMHVAIVVPRVRLAHSHSAEGGSQGRPLQHALACCSCDGECSTLPWLCYCEVWQQLCSQRKDWCRSGMHLLPLVPTDTASSTG